MKRKLVTFFSEISEKYNFLLEAKIIYWATMPTYPSFFAKLFFFQFFWRNFVDVNFLKSKIGEI